MATRSRIGIKNEDGSISSIYCHWDGYPEHNGKILKEHYTDPEKVKALMVLGDLSSLNEEIGESQDFDRRETHHEKWCLAYGRDRGEPNTSYKNHPTEKEFLETTKGSWGEYAYIFEEGIWKVAGLAGENFMGWEAV